MVTRAGPRSGTTHARYDHAARPTLIALRCPACGAESHATLPSHVEGKALSGDLSPEHHASAWRVVCRSCPHRAGPFTYEALRAYAPLWFDASERGEALWAWNREHLGMIIDVLEGRDVTGHPYGWLATYVPGAWKRRRARSVKLARRLIER